MKHKQGLLIAAGVCTLFMLSLAAPLVAKEAPQVILKIGKGERVVHFDHLTHEGVDCLSCHHKTNGKESYRGCAACHSTDKDKKEASTSYFNVIHFESGLKSDPANRCVACHIDEGVTVKDDQQPENSCLPCHTKG